MSRNPKDLTPEMQAKYTLFCEDMNRAGQNFILTCTLRTQTEQDALYEQGRTTPGIIVTWTRKSNHLKGTAFDIAMLDKNGKIDWNPSSYEKAGEIGESIGLVWGGSWSKKKDVPHFELP